MPPGMFHAAGNVSMLVATDDSSFEMNNIQLYSRAALMFSVVHRRSVEEAIISVHTHTRSVSDFPRELTCLGAAPLSYILNAARGPSHNAGPTKPQDEED